MKAKIIIYAITAICAASLSACSESPRQRQAEELLTKKVYPGSDVKVLSFDFVAMESVNEQLNERIAFYRNLCDLYESDVAISKELNDLAISLKSKKAIDISTTKLRESRQRFEKACVTFNKLTRLYEKYSNNSKIVEQNDLSFATYYLLRYKLGFQTGALLLRFRENSQNNECAIVAYKDTFSDWVAIGNWYQIPDFVDTPSFAK